MTARRRIAVVVGIAAATLLVLPGAEAQTTATRIMPLGDSITDGFNVPGGYRIDLEDELAADGSGFDFVGSLSNGPAALSDKNHEGHSGFRIDQIASSISGWLSSSQPDIVLLMIGTNDVLQDYQLTTAPDRLASLLDQIHAARPQTSLLVASIPPLPGSTDDQQVRSYNAAIPGLVQTRAGQGRLIRYVEVHAALTTADLADGVHPSAVGYSKIADVWHAALIPLLGGNEPPTTSLTAPASGSTFAYGEDVVFAATASDGDGAIARVEFIADGSEVGEDAAAPYGFAWIDPPVGGHSLIARAVDNAGATASSTPISITVAGPPGSGLYRAVNLGGPAVTIDGVVWEATTASNVRTIGNVWEDQSGAMDPATDAARMFMLRSVIWGSSLSGASLLSVPSGMYDVFVSIWEDNNSATVDVRLEGQLVRQGYRTGAQGHWERLGPFRVSITDGGLDLTAGPDANLSGLEVFTVGGAGSPSITTTSLPSATVGIAYSVSLQATGGTAPYTWSVDAGGSLPPGLSLTSTGAVSGTPTSAGTSTFTARVTDNAGQSDTQPLSIAVAEPPSPTITTTGLPGGTVGVAFNQTLQATGGTPPYTWSVDAGGSLPPGLSLDSSSGAITGTPTSAGTSTFTARVRDSQDRADTQSLTITVAPGGAPLVITTTSLSTGTVGTFYSSSLQATGGTPPYQWSLVSGSLPRGLTITTAGVISGTPTKHGVSNFTVRVVAGTQATRSLSLRISR